MGWRIVGVLALVFLGLIVLGAVIRALRFLIGLAIIVAIIAALVGAGSRSKKS